MAAARAFLFDTDFGAPAKAAEPQIALVEHEAALARAEASALARGRQQAAAERVADAERRTADSIERLSADLSRLLTHVGSLERRLQREAVEVAVAVARKLSGALIAAQPNAELVALVEDCIGELRTTPHVVIRVNDALLAPLQGRLTRVASEAGFTGRLVMLAEPSIAVGDGRIEWADGGVVRDTAATLAKIDELVQHFVAASAAGHAAETSDGH